MDKAILKPGDILLYKGTGAYGLLIQLKCWSAIGHCESYIGDGFSVASRNGIGVNIYPLKEKDLIRVIRPNREFNLGAAIKWFLLEAKGQKYDWLGLLRFTWGSDYCKGDKNNKMFCSEFLTRYYRAGGLDPFPNADADSVPPNWFDVSPLFDRIWSAE